MISIQILSVAKALARGRHLLSSASLPLVEVSWSALTKATPAGAPPPAEPLSAPNPRPCEQQRSRVISSRPPVPPSPHPPGTARGPNPLVAGSLVHGLEMGVQVVRLVDLHGCLALGPAPRLGGPGARQAHKSASQMSLTVVVSQMFLT